MAAAAALLAPAGRARADGAGAPETTEASFAAARLRDDLAGSIADAAKEIRITFRALSQGNAKLSATLGPDRRDRAAAGAGGLSLKLCDAQGTDLSPARTYPFAGGLRWRNVPVPATGEFTLIVRATTPGTWRLQLSGAHGRLHVEDTSPGLAPGAEDDVEFDALAGSVAAWALDRTGTGAKFVGEAVHVVAPDGGTVAVTNTATGRVTLTQDGRHRLVYRNAGTSASPAGTRVRVDVAPARPLLRTGYVAPEGTSLVPVVLKVDPPSAFQKEDALAVTITGRDFQDGADVRLVRSGRADLLATSVVVRSETEIDCVLDLDTEPDGLPPSAGTWTVGVWNAPVYGTPGDRATLVHESRTRSLSKKFQSLASGAIRLPNGVWAGAEVWHVHFNADFQDDLDAMGLGSADVTTRKAMRTAVEAYTILHLRDLFAVHETTGRTIQGSVPVCFLVDPPPGVAGEPGVDWNRIEVGGAWQSGDAHDAAEPLFWGYADIDATLPGFTSRNLVRNDLSVLDADGNRIGHGARTAVLDPQGSVAASGWQAVMLPKLTLTAADYDRFLSGPPAFVTQADADRYETIVRRVERASREIAAIVAHHVGKAMGIEDGVASGPMSNPTKAGDLWADVATSARFSSGELAAMRAAAVPHALPGVSKQLAITYFPMMSTHPFLLEECKTDSPYSTRFGFVGGRPNAVKSDWKVQYVAGSVLPAGLTLSFDGLDGKAPLWLDQGNNVFYYARAIFRVAVTDKVRGGVRQFQFRCNIVPDDVKLGAISASLGQAARNAANLVRQ